MFLKAPKFQKATAAHSSAVSRVTASALNSILLRKVFYSINKLANHKMDKMIHKAPSGSVNVS